MYRLARLSRILLVAVLPACGGGDFTSKTRSSSTGPDAALDGSAPSSGSAKGSGGGGNSSGGSGADAGASAGGDQGSGGTLGTGGTDAGSPGNGGAAGAGGSSAGGTASSGGNGNGGVNGSGGSCPDPTTWYLDVDQDGYGSDTAKTVVSCTQPQGHYVKIGGDCNDNESKVHPQLTQQEVRFFGTPYRARNGTDSYDYDCSGVETGDPSQPKAGACVWLSVVGNCAEAGNGYVAETGGGQTSSNPFCGSQKLQTCTKTSVVGTCATTTTDAPAPYRCN